MSKKDDRVRSTADWLKRRGEVELDMSNWGSLEEYRQIKPKENEDK